MNLEIRDVESVNVDDLWPGDEILYSTTWKRVARVEPVEVFNALPRHLRNVVHFHDGGVVYVGDDKTFLRTTRKSVV